MKKIIFSLLFIITAVCSIAQNNSHSVHAIRFSHTEDDAFNWAESISVDIPIIITDNILNIYTEIPQTFRITGDPLDVDQFSKQWSAIDGNDVTCSIKFVSINAKFFCYIYYADVAYFYRIAEYE
jgi:hypothetical protein